MFIGKANEMIEHLVAQPEEETESDSTVGDSTVGDSPVGDSTATGSPITDSPVGDSSAEGVTILNFSHPITGEQMSQIRDMAGAEIRDVISVDSRVDLSAPLAEQVARMVESVPFSGEDWQVKPVLVNLPGLSASAAVLLSELSGRMGYLPSVIRMRMAGSTPPKFEVAEIINLQAIRSEARNRRSVP